MTRSRARKKRQRKNQQNRQAHEDESSDGIPVDKSDPIQEIIKLLVEKFDTLEGIGPLDFLGSAAVLGMITNVADLAAAYSCSDGGCESKGKMGKAGVLLVIHTVLAIYWLARRNRLV